MTARTGVLALAALAGCASTRLRTASVAVVAGPVGRPAAVAAQVPIPGTVAVTAAQVARALEGHGEWFEVPNRGRVWIPHAPSSFVPYLTDGHWVPTSAGWFWSSTLPWGAIPFHHGRWIMLGARWAWVPGSQFAPAWVDWRAGSGWYGWAPQAPVGEVARNSFVFCAASYALRPDLAQHVVTDLAAAAVFPRTAPIAPRPGLHDARYAHGPEIPSPMAVLPSLDEVLAAQGDLRSSRLGSDHPQRLTGLRAASPPEEIPEVPESHAPAHIDDEPGPHGPARVAVLRLRAADLARVSAGRVSIVNLPAAARAALFAPRAAVRASTTLASEPVETPPPLPPPADLPAFVIIPGRAPARASIAGPPAAGSAWRDPGTPALSMVGLPAAPASSTLGGGGAWPGQDARPGRAPTLGSPPLSVVP